MGGKTFKYNWKLIQQEYDSGLSYRDLIAKYGMSTATLTAAKKRGDLIIRSRSEGNSLAKITKPYKHSRETKQKLSKIRSKNLNGNAFYSKRFVYNGITLDSSYELKVAQCLDENSISWIRPKSLKWNDNGQLRRYIPDFYLPDYDVYLDPKNDYLIKKDERKIRLAEDYNNVKIFVLDKDNLTWDKINKIIRGSETW